MTTLVSFNKSSITKRMMLCGCIINSDIGWHIGQLYRARIRRDHMEEKLNAILIILSKSMNVFAGISKDSMIKLLQHEFAPVLCRGMEVKHSDGCSYKIDGMEVWLYAINRGQNYTYHIQLHRCDCDNYADNDLWDDDRDDIFETCTESIESYMEFLTIAYISGDKFFIRLDDLCSGVEYL